MTLDEKNLLNNILDGLDRLFDRESDVIDIYALIFATSKALHNTEYFSILDRTANNLEKILLSASTANNGVFEALEVTNDLRIFLAEILEF